MLRFSFKSWVAIIACGLLVMFSLNVNALPLNDDKTDEMDLKPTTERSENKPTNQEEEARTITDDPNDHIQVIKMELTKKELKDIEKIEEEIVKDFDVHSCFNITVKDDIDENEGVDGLFKNGDKNKRETSTKVATQCIVMQDARSSRNMKIEKPKEDSTGLTDDEISEIVQMIAFPKEENTKTNTAEDEKKSEQEIGPRSVIIEDEDEAESSSVAKTRVSRAIRSNGQRDYYILAFSPLEGPVVPAAPAYTKIDIIPIERSANGLQDDDNDDEDYNEPIDDADDAEGRFISSKQFNRYIRRMMHQIRKGTRKIQRKTFKKTHFKAADEEEENEDYDDNEKKQEELVAQPTETTVEDFLRKIYKTRQEHEAAPKRSWFAWGQ